LLIDKRWDVRAGWLGVFFDLWELPAGGKLSVLPLQILHGVTACQATFSFLFTHAIVIQSAQDN